MSDDDTMIEVPITLAIDGVESATLTFGPMSIRGLGDFLENLGTAQGYVHFREQLDSAIEQGLDDAKARQAAAE